MQPWQTQPRVTNAYEASVPALLAESSLPASVFIVPNARVKSSSQDARDVPQVAVQAAR